MIPYETKFNPNIHSHKKRHQSFLIEVSHCVNKTTNHWDEEVKEHMLCLYCYIFDNHPLFEQLTSIKPYDFAYAWAVVGFNFHRGVTYAMPILSHDIKGELKLGSIKVGCDYNHYQDEFYTEDHYFPDNLRTVCNDAQRLYEYLEKLFTDAKKEDPCIGTDTAQVLAIPVIEEKDITDDAS